MDTPPGESWSPGLRIALGTLLCLAAAAGYVYVYHLGEQAARRSDQLVAQPAPLPEQSGDEAFLRVHVTGAVNTPGVYHFGADDRVLDAIERAGGQRDGARLDDLNLAARLSDGMRLYVPGPDDGPTDRILVVTEDVYARPPPPPRPADGEPTGEAETTYLGAVGPSDKPAAGPSLPAGPVDLNQATLAELETLPGIGPVLAGRILAYRETHGRFGGPEEIQQVSGIGPATYEKLKPYLVVR